MSTAFRLTAETISDEALVEAAVEKAGLLGGYTLDEYERLTENTPKDWTFEWVPSKMDANFGRVKMRPKSKRGMELLDKGRAKKLLDRHPDLSLKAAINVVGVVKRHKRGMDKRVQDMAIRHCTRQELYTEEGSFMQRWKRHVGGKLSAEQIQAISELLEPVYQALHGEAQQPEAERAGKKRHQRKRRESKGSEQKQESGNSEQGNSQPRHENQGSGGEPGGLTMHNVRGSETIMSS